MPLDTQGRKRNWRHGGIGKARGRWLLAIGATLLSGTGGTVRAQEAEETPQSTKKPAQVQVAPVQIPPGDAPPIRFRERPKYQTEPKRLRRTARIDGVLGDGEYTEFYTVADGPVTGTIYCNWDENYLYLAAKTDQPCGLLFDLDMGSDGWLRGANNLELVIGSIVEGQAPNVLARLLDASSSKESPAWNETSIDPKSILAAGRIAGGGQFVEIAIPKSAASLVLRPGATLGLRAEFLPPGPATAYEPTAPFEPHLLLDAILADTVSQAVTGVTAKLTLSDYKCVGGQNLFATLELLNQTDIALPIRSVAWAGEGNSANAVNGVREIVVPQLEGMKTLRLKYRTPLPSDLAPGSYTLMVTADMGEGKKVTSSAAFTVVEPVQVQMLAQPDPLAIVGPTKLTATMDVFSAVPDHLRGDIEWTTIPAGWELAGGKKRPFFINGSDKRGQAKFTFKLLSTTPPGDYPLEAVLIWRGRPFKARRVVHVVSGPTPASAPAPSGVNGKK